MEQVAAAGGDIDDDEAIITGTGMVVGSGGMDHEEGQHTPEFKVWPEGQDDESRNSAASSHQHHVENASTIGFSIGHLESSASLQIRMADGTNLGEKNFAYPKVNLDEQTRRTIIVEKVTGGRKIQEDLWDGHWGYSARK